MEPDRADSLRPNLILIGAQKAASTFVHHNLARHPDIRFARPEVVCFQMPDYREAAVRVFPELFAGAGASRYRAIRRPNYLGDPDVPARIRDLCPEARLVAMLRNPAERAVSAYFHYMAFGQIPVRPVEEGLAAILDGAYAEDHPRGGEILEYGLYGKHLARYREHFPVERMHIGLFDDLKESAEAYLAGLYRFLELEPPAEPAPVDGGRYSVSYNYTRARLRALHRRWLLRFTYYPQGESGIEVCDPPAWARLVGLGLRGAGKLAEILRPGRRPGLSDSLRQRVQAYYEDDIRRLSDLLDRDLSAWLR